MCDILPAVLEEDVLSFQWKVQDEKDGIRLQIYFHDKGESDIAILTFVSNDNNFGPILSGDSDDNLCILSGYLKCEPDVDVAVTGCPGDNSFQVKTVYQTCLEIYTKIIFEFSFIPFQLINVFNFIR